MTTAPSVNGSPMEAGEMATIYESVIIYVFVADPNAEQELYAARMVKSFSPVTVNPRLTNAGSNKITSNFVGKRTKIRMYCQYVEIRGKKQQSIYTFRLN